MAVITVFDADGNEYAMEVEDPDQVPENQRTPAEWAKLRRSEKAARDAKASQDLADRMLAFYRAGINPDDARMSYFVKGYDGDLSMEAIKNAAMEAGFLAGDTAPPPPDPTQQGADIGATHAANGRITQAGAGGVEDQRSPINALIDADAQGGRQAMIDHLRAQGIPIQFDSQE